MQPLQEWPFQFSQNAWTVDVMLLGLMVQYVTKKVESAFARIISKEISAMNARVTMLVDQIATDAMQIPMGFQSAKVCKPNPMKVMYLFNLCVCFFCGLSLISHSDFRL